MAERERTPDDEQVRDTNEEAVTDVEDEFEDDELDDDMEDDEEAEEEA